MSAGGHNHKEKESRVDCNAHYDAIGRFSNGSQEHIKAACRGAASIWPFSCVASADGTKLTLLEAATSVMVITDVTFAASVCSFCGDIESLIARFRCSSP